jgi:Toxin PAAR-like domain
MPVTIKVNGRSNSLVHKGSNHFARNTAPDVCKTPSPGGPVPIPYPVIMSLSNSLDKGTTTVKADGGNMCGVKGSEFSRCNGDEAGTAGGVVSSTNMKESTWITYSFDVKLDGKNACRLTDKMKMNHGNTVCLAGDGGLIVDAQIGEVFDHLCDRLCASNHKSSNDLEKSCQRATKPNFKKDYNVHFRKSFKTPRFKVKKTKPDAVMLNDKGKPIQCFDFKRCGDRVRHSEKQAERQMFITEEPKRELIVVSPETCGDKCPDKCK